MNFTDILDQHRVPYQTHGRYCRIGWVQFSCPFCSGGSDPNKLYAGYNLAYGYVNCWRSGRHGIAETISRLTGISLREAIDVAKDVPRDATQQRKEAARRRGTVTLPKGVGSLLGAHKRYLRSRGYDPKQLEAVWEIQGIGIAAKLAWRIFIPIVWQGKIVSWTTRSVRDAGQRYISASAAQEALNHKHLLYGLDYCRNSAIVVEGPFDVWRIGPGAVATLGTGFTSAQLRLLAQIPTRVVCYDNEPEAQRRAGRLCDALEAFDGETYNVVLSGKDASDTIAEDIERLRKEFL